MYTVLHISISCEDINIMKVSRMRPMQLVTVVVYNVSEYQHIIL